MIWNWPWSRPAAEPRAPERKDAGGYGFVALHAAAQNGDDDLAALLLERGADRGLAADDGRTAVEIALQAGHTRLADSLA